MARCHPETARSYEPRRPRETVLHKLLLAQLETLVAQARASDEGAGLPAYVERELRAVIGCGDPAAGFLRLRCDRCAHEMLCPFSCGSRTACPSCATRRMEAMTARLCSEVLPDVAVTELLKRAKIACVPGTAFYQRPVGDTVIRFCFAKEETALAEACKRIEMLKSQK